MHFMPLPSPQEANSKTDANAAGAAIRSTILALVSLFTEFIPYRPLNTGHAPVHVKTVSVITECIQRNLAGCCAAGYIGG